MLTDAEKLAAMQTAEKLAMARQQLGHEAGERTGMRVPQWQGLTDHEREISTLDARNYLIAAKRAGLLPSGHWRARFAVTYHDEPDRSRTYEAWIGAGSEEEARQLLAKQLSDSDVASWDLEELIDATAGEPAVIATWLY